MNAPIRIKKVRPGDDTDTYCGRCKAERTHQVIALNADGAPATVICRTCGGQHRYHQKKEPSAARPSAGGAARKTRAAADPARDVPRGPVRPYSPKETYAEGEWLDHPKFGQGRVAHARGGKIEVRFDSDSRLLVHAG
ncbi:MAG TPA: hypothetical protein VF659_04210 [Pyrinomonadaceae bacterium]|jgi:hypothetical protein